MSCVLYLLSLRELSTGSRRKWCDDVIELAVVFDKTNTSGHHSVWLSDRRSKRQLEQGSSQVLNHWVGSPKYLRGSRVVHDALDVVRSPTPAAIDE